jgi:hypothetical protein
MDNVVNWEQFESIPPERMDYLKKDGFAISYLTNQHDSA